MGLRALRPWPLARFRKTKSKSPALNGISLLFDLPGMVVVLHNILAFIKPAVQASSMRHFQFMALGTLN